MKQTEIDRERIARDTAEFLANGGKIQQIPYLHCGEERIMLKRREESKDRVVYLSGRMGTLK